MEAERAAFARNDLVGTKLSRTYENEDGIFLNYGIILSMHKWS